MKLAVIVGVLVAWAFQLTLVIGVICIAVHFIKKLW